jgi:hypothetical protein
VERSGVHRGNRGGRLFVVIRSGGRAIGIVVAMISVVLACAGSAYANRVYYSTPADIGVYFYLSGKNCPKGPHCFDHAKLVTFSAFWEQYPNCPEVNLSGGFEYGNYGDLHGKPVKVNKRRRFHGEGDSINYEGDHVSFGGHFLRNHAKAKGWFRIVETNAGESCDSGRVDWSARVFK